MLAVHSPRRLIKYSLLNRWRTIKTDTVSVIDATSMRHIFCRRVPPRLWVSQNIFPETVYRPIEWRHTSKMCSDLIRSGLYVQSSPFWLAPSVADFAIAHCRSPSKILSPEQKRYIQCCNHIAPYCVDDKHLRKPLTFHPWDNGEDQGNAKNVS
jgi:hypothetical protein